MCEDWIAIERSECNEQAEQKDVIYSWMYSPSGRYAIDFDYKEIVQQEEEPETHYFLFRFFVLDLIEKNWCPYTVKTGPFRRFYSFYWLSDSHAVLLDFTKRDSSVRQNVLVLDHVNKTVTCSFARNIEFDVDYMCYSKDLTAQRLIHAKGELLLLCGFRNPAEGLMCRLVPYSPLVDFFLTSDTFCIKIGSIINSLSPDEQLCAGGHPFVYGSKLTFLLFSRDASKVFHYVNYTLQIDLDAAINDAQRVISAEHARLNTFVFSQNPNWKPKLNCIPNVYNTARFVALWESPLRSKKYRVQKTKIYILDLKMNVMKLFYSSLLRNDFVCIHPNGCIFTFIQTVYGMKMKMTQPNLLVNSLRSLCQQEIVRRAHCFTELPSPILTFLFKNLSY
ncbi:unnamed protein product [Cylicocyclus nassatus]|uniref:SOCS box domain-containing protein n=1 Tax=Cylicocyclus nassatus TaxID=53992 RepID=A0AA36H1T4_CYLNA|nr:unnamed protein product [Cylicocyclus nassatus]